MRKMLLTVVLVSMLFSIALSESNKGTKYDKLQFLFSTITFNTTMKEVEDYIADNELAFFKDRYNGHPAHYTYKIAFTKDDLLSQGSRDIVEISFNRSNREFLYATYHNGKSFLTAFI